MAASLLYGDKICEAAGEVKWSNVERFILDYHSGSLALYKLSNSYYLHGITADKRVKVKRSDISALSQIKSYACTALLLVHVWLNLRLQCFFSRYWEKF